MALTIRLDEQEEKELRKIINTLKVSTSSGAIKKMINDYHADLDSYHTIVGKYESVARQLSELQAEIILTRELKIQAYETEQRIKKLCGLDYEE